MNNQPLAIKTIPKTLADTPSWRVTRYWHRHPARAFALMRAMLKANPAPYKHEGWPRIVSQSKYIWHKNRSKPTINVNRPDKILFRNHPKPYQYVGNGACPMCGGIRYNLGWHTDWDGLGRSKQGWWHAACKSADHLMTAPNDFAGFFYARQDGLCAITGEPLGNNYQIDHTIPLYLVYRDYGHLPIDVIISFWGTDNLRAVTIEAHKVKNKYEAWERKTYLAALPPRERQ